VISDITRASVAEMLGGISDIAQNYKYSIKLFAIVKIWMYWIRSMTSLLNKLMVCLYLNDELNEKRVEDIKRMFNSNGIPFVFANVVSDDPDVPTVSIDYEKAGYEITKLMIS
jgi:LacI family transcriptional regulator